MKYTEILEQLINEINMSPASLKQLAQGIDARAGMEFEMIVPDVGSIDDDDFESEPDYDQDTSADSFNEIERFFDDGEHNSSRAVRRLMEALEEEFLDSDWLSEKKQEAWGDSSYQSVKELVERDYEDKLIDQARQEILDDTPEFGTNAEELSSRVDARAQELMNEKVDEILADMGSDYDEAYEDWENNGWYEYINDNNLRDDWLHDAGYYSMSDISNNFDIEWPYWTEDDSYGNGEENVARIAKEFGDYLGKKINYSTSYHGARRTPDGYVVEPDGSLEGDNAGDQGLEFVSPPMPIKDLLADLIAVKEWADNNNCYTNDSTGLHINVSVPNYSLEKLDYVKLAILLGDERVLNEFGRLGNTYCKSALSIVKQNIKTRPDEASALLGKMKEHLGTAAAKVIHSGITNKFTSINTKDGYIEFRSPGGDWLNTNFEMIEPTLLRFVVALDAAIDETKYKQEYAKKLYKLLAPSTHEPGILELFANYSAGDLPKDALIRQVRSAQLQRDMSKGKTPPGTKYWWRVDKEGAGASNGASIEIVAANKDEALQKAAVEWGVEGRVGAMSNATAKPMYPYKEPPATIPSQEGNWGIWISSSERFARDRNNNDQLRRFPSREAGEEFLTTTRAGNPNMRTDVEVREIPADYNRPANFAPATRPDNTTTQQPSANTAPTQEWEIANHATGEVVERFTGTRQEANAHALNTYGHRFIFDVRAAQANSTTPAATTPTQFTGEWRVVDSAGQELYKFSGVGNSQSDANRVAATWIRNNPGVVVSGEVSVVPVMV